MEAKDIVKQIALKVFGTNDGVKPSFPKSGEPIQAAMEESFKAGRDYERKYIHNREWGIK